MNVLQATFFFHKLILIKYDALFYCEFELCIHVSEMI